MVQTRSAAKRQQAAEEVQRLNKVPKDLGREATVVEITSSATGLGTHIRWLRPPQGPNEMPEILSPDMTLDPRFVTPPPETPALMMRTPPKLIRQRRIGNPGIFNTGTTVRFNVFRHEIEHIIESARVHGRDLLTEFERYSQEIEGTSSDPRYNDVIPTDTFGNILEYHTPALLSPFSGTQGEGSTPLSLGPDGLPHLDTPLNNFGSAYTGPPSRLGPHGTHLDISQDDFTFTCSQTSLSFTEGDLLMGRVQGLGPCDTVLIGPDGRALVSGIRAGY